MIGRLAKSFARQRPVSKSSSHWPGRLSWISKVLSLSTRSTDLLSMFKDSHAIGQLLHPYGKVKKCPILPIDGSSLSG